MAVPLVVVGGLMSWPALGAAAQAPCRLDIGSCMTIEVPLDRSGAVPGAVAIHVDRDGVGSSLDPPLLALGGRPGEAATDMLDVGSIGEPLGPRPSARLAPLRPPVDRRARELLVMDLRGTGRSGALRCRLLERAGTAGMAEAAAECASALGARRGFYTARDSAEDVEAVRRALGVEKIALFGVSYGARVALTYAQRHPDRVDRLLLQSPPPPEGEDLLYRSAFAAVPAVVEATCGRRGCRPASRSPVPDVIALAQRLERGPIRGSVVDGDGRRRTLRLRGRDLFEALGGTGFPSFSFPDSAAACAARLGARRGLYTARDSAQDVEAVRRALACRGRGARPSERALAKPLPWCGDFLGVRSPRSVLGPRSPATSSSSAGAGRMRRLRPTHPRRYGRSRPSCSLGGTTSGRPSASPRPSLG